MSRSQITACEREPSPEPNLTWPVMVCVRRRCQNDFDHRYMSEAVMLSQTAGPEGFIHPNWFFPIQDVAARSRRDRERMEQGR